MPTLAFISMSISIDAAAVYISQLFKPILEFPL